jgi:hypothetical protein
VGLDVRDDARGRTYRVVRPPRGPAVLTREAPGVAPLELCRAAGRGGASWTALARSVLEDATGERPGGKVARDLGRFLVTPRGGERRMSGEELAAWLATWRPHLSGIFPGARRRGPGGPD